MSAEDLVQALFTYYLFFSLVRPASLVRIASVHKMAAIHTKTIPAKTSLISHHVTAAMLVERTIAKKSFGNLTLLLCKT